MFSEMDSELTDSKGNTLVLHVRIPRLKDMAAIKVAISLWYHRLLGDEHDDESLLGLYQHLDDVTQSAVSLELPRSVESVIDIHVETVASEMSDFVRYVRSEFLLENEFNRSHLRCCVWIPDGRINYAKSIRELLVRGGLTDVERLAVMFEYCLEDVVETVSLVSIPQSFIDGVTFEEAPLWYYWICRMKNELHKIPVEGGLSLEMVMIERCEWYNWSSIEYFWDRLSEQERFTFAVGKLNFRLKSSALLNEILGKLNESQRLRLFCEIPIDIIAQFWLCMQQYGNALVVWSLVKNHVTNEQFATLLEKLFIPFEYTLNIEALVELWNAALDCHRDYWWDNKKEVVMRAYCTPPMISSIRDCRFLCVMVAYLPLARRKEVFRGYEDVLVVNNHFTEVDPLVKICFPEEEEKVLFKKCVLRYKSVIEYYSSLFAKNEFAYLNASLKYYSTDDACRRQLKRYIFENGVTDNFVFVPPKWRELNELVDDIYIDEWQRTKAKKAFLWSRMEKAFDSYYWIDTRALELIESLASELLDEREVVTVKNMMWKRFCEVYESKSSWFMCYGDAGVYFEELVCWCLGSEQNLAKIKKKFMNFEEIILFK